MNEIKYNITCPKCKSSSFTFIFKRKIYLVDSENNFMLGVLYGCDKCNIAFTMAAITNSIKNPSDKKENIDKIQSAFGKLSNGCNKILENIK